jgi:uncharacterized protein YhbP (UPF0306 family)
MSGLVPEHTRHFIQAHFTLSLATADGDQPWVAALYYVSDGDMNLYFISDPDTRHVREGLRTGTVAVAIHGAHQPWATIRGIQMQGRLEAIAPGERERVAALYFARFTDVGMLVRSPADATQSRIAEKFGSSVFYRVTPLRLRYIDNTRGFGKPEEIGLHAP